MAECKAGVLDRLVGVLTYFTFGMAGFIWLLVIYFTKGKLRNFAAFHIYQSIFLGLLLTVVSWAMEYVFIILYKIPFLGTYVEKLFILLVKTPIYLAPLNFSILYAVTFVSIAYLSIGAIIGKLSYVPWVSDIIKANLRWDRE